MIRVRRGAVARPSALDGPASRGGQERAEATAFYADDANAQSTFAFRAYKDDSVKQALNELFAFKCAYCESSYAATQPVDVEHFRPKGAVVHGGRLRKPGYYWLAAEWENLLPSCIDCNRPRTQEFPDMDAELSGKANLFPIANEGRRAESPGNERLERRLLLDPCRDHPDRHLEFLDDGNVRPRRRASGRKSEKGEVSIETYGLRRRGLMHERAARAERILFQVAQINRLLRLLDRLPDDADVETMLEDAMRELRAFTDEDREYAGMARQIVERTLHID